MWLGHMARATEGNPAAAILRWRCPHWWRMCQELDGPTGWRHARTKWSRGPEDSVTAVKDRHLPEAAQDRKAWDKGRNAFMTAATRNCKWQRRRLRFGSRRRRSWGAFAPLFLPSISPPGALSRFVWVPLTLPGHSVQ